jgi:Glycosyltransferase family 87
LSTADSVTPLKTIAAALMIALGISILAYAMSADEAATRDYISYWATGQQLRHHANPYDAAGILAAEKSSGYKADHALVMRNPPTALMMAYPLGFISAKTGAVLWSIALVACLMASIRMLWILNGRPNDRLHLAGYLFPPALACLLAGQTGIFLLFGVVLFLYFKDSWLAGVGLFVFALKPHLFLPFGCVFVLWALQTKQWRVMMGLFTTVAFSLAVALLLDQSCFAHYLAMARSEGIATETVPTLSLLFRLFVARDHPWVQFVPSAMACLWAVRRYLDDREFDVPFLLLVSVMVAPYAWFTDEAVLLPAILAGLYHSSARSLIAYCCIAGIALIEVFTRLSLTSAAYLWTTPAWWLWYVFATRSIKPPASGVVG